MANPLKKIGHALHPALFGNYDMNGVTVGSIGLKPRHFPAVTAGIGLVPGPQREFIGRPVGTASPGPGFTLRIGGDTDKTEPILKKIVSRIKK